jgi:hypothetical protein
MDLTEIGSDQIDMPQKNLQNTVSICCRHSPVIDRRLAHRLRNQNMIISSGTARGHGISGASQTPTPPNAVEGARAPLRKN